MKVLYFIWEGIRMAVGALWGNRLRTFLTMLGVATGIFAITAILTMVHSMKYALSENLASLGNRTLFVHNWPWKDNSEDWFKFFNRPKVSYGDYQQLKQKLRDVEGVAYETHAGGQLLKSEGKSVENAEAFGVTFDYGNLLALDIVKGRYFSEFETEGGAPVCIIGNNIAEGLFGENEDGIGKYIRLRGNRLKVIGILKKKGSGIAFGAPEDDKIIMPYNFVAQNFNLNSRRIDKVIIIKAIDYKKLDWVESEITGLLRAKRDLKPSSEDNFSINKQEMLMKQIDTIFGYLEIGGWVITLFSLLIGGFSIFNIMYISVKERTNEIGIQKALGASQGFILYQFMTESLILCLLGGLLGVGILYVAVQIAQQAIMNLGISMSLVVASEDVALAIGISGFIGLIAGIIPSGMAASVDPVVAIRAK